MLSGKKRGGKISLGNDPSFGMEIYHYITYYFLIYGIKRPADADRDVGVNESKKASLGTFGAKEEFNYRDASHPN